MTKQCVNFLFLNYDRDTLISVVCVNRINTNTDAIYPTHSASVMDICPQTVILTVGRGGRVACQCVCVCV